jgi:hypothetical protein
LGAMPLKVEKSIISGGVSLVNEMLVKAVQF